MITFRTFAEVMSDRQVVVSLPPETPVGRAELVVTVSPVENPSSSKSSVRPRFGTVRGGASNSADNERIDIDLARAYGNPQE